MKCYKFVFLFFVCQFSLQVFCHPDSKKEIKLEGDHFFLGSFQGKLSHQIRTIKSYKRSSRVSHFHIEHDQYVRTCVHSHTETRLSYTRNGVRSYTVTVCDERKAVLSRYETVLSLERKRLGLDYEKEYQLSFWQTALGEPLSFKFEDKNVSSQRRFKRKVRGLKTLFNYRGKRYIRDRLAFNLGPLTSSKLRQMSYFKRNKLDISSQTGSNIIKLKHFAPIAKEITVTVPGSVKSKDYDVNLEYFALDNVCLQTVNVVHNGYTRQKCIAYASKPSKKTKVLRIKDRSRISKAKKITVLVLQNHTKKVPAVYAKPLQKNKNLVLSVHRRVGHVSIKIRKKL